MYRIIFCLGLSLLTVSSPLLTQAAAGKMVQTDPKYITHKVVAGETLYSLSRKYGISVSEISKLNPEVKAGLKVGQTLRFPENSASGATPVAAPKPTTPAPKPAAPAAKPIAEKPVAETPAKPAPVAELPETSGRKIYKVGPKETLYAVAVKHGVTMAEIRKWNNLKEDKLAVGQQLIVNAPAATAVTKPAETPKVTVVKEEVKTKADKVKTETKTEATVTVIDEKDDDNEAENASVEAAGKITETGLAEVITQAGDNNKYLALHKTAPIGTILQVKNIMNGQNVYVRVIGKLPETGANERVIVRISKKAYQRLAAIDNRFRVEVSYMP
ncbi:LysM peptidoglycan-binding domain-containing protein [Adhaeribacter sp. BT258]|uniref:LysM peptidoglycan-binding domain-containing protein n=1 Tax=Adhaeribacter terrigena TaxID=2793070 RepID=A0ABS1BZE8_9BACT|nr:LysM peptidoglycan-binding domain-containing protein [Adhaeribacter terrigena]MBK0402521.1 LysM peptidoglycan-binding domain-containing protein [Adhaeribacter terrigena]